MAKGGQLKGSNCCILAAILFQSAMYVIILRLFFIYTYIQIGNMKTNSPTCLIAAQTARGVFTFSALAAALFTAGVVQASSVFELGGVVVRGDLNTAGPNW